MVHVSWEDAAANARWAGKRLPTEAEWEFAARSGIKQARFAWGDEVPQEGKPRANYWQGTFPTNNACSDGFAGTSPVKSFPPNGYGIYDMIGNVWEWTADWYSPDTYVALAGKLAVNPQGPVESWTPDAPRAQRRATRGGSFLCSENFCTKYRPSARQGNDWDTSTSHIGFRCVVSTEPKE